MLIAVALLLGVAEGYANDSTSIGLNEAVVSAHRWRSSAEVHPVKISSYKQTETNAYNPQTTADMLALGGEVFVQKSQYAGGSPMIRGFATNRLLYSMDGVRMNTAIFRSGNIQNVISFDPFAIEQTEVLFGPGAVMYGSDAVGGTMVFNTLTPRLATAKSPVVYGGATVRTATASNELTAHAHAGIGWKRWALLTSFTTSSFGDLEQGIHGPEEYVMPYIVTPYYDQNGVNDVVAPNNDPRRQAPSSYTQHNVMQKVRYAPSAAWNLEYAFHWSKTSDYARYDRHQRTRKNLPRYAEWNYGPQRWMMNHLRVEHLGQTAAYDSLRINLAWQQLEESRISRDLNKPLRETQTEEVDTWSANVDFVKGLTRNLSLFYGAEYVQNNVCSTGEGKDVVTGERSTIAARYPEAEWYSMGVYAQAEWAITPRLNAVAGLRYNHNRIDCDFSTAGYEVPFASQQTAKAGNVSGNVGFNWRPASGWLFRVNYARGFRAPNVDDMGKLFDSADGCVTVPNPSLKPEYANNIDLGIAHRWGKVLEVSATGYYTHLDNAIVRRDYLFNGSPTLLYSGEECRVQALQNAAVARVWGIQAEAKANFAKWFYARANVNWQKGREELDDGSTSPSRHAAPLFGKVALGFQHTKAHVEFYSLFQAQRNAEDMPEEEKDKKEFYALDADGNAYAPGWITLNLRASYQFTKPLTLHATLENIADRRYRPYSSGISAPGRNFTLSFTYAL